MRKSLIVLGVVLSSLGLSACGAKTTLSQGVASLGASANLQVHVSATVSGAGSAQASTILKELSLDLRYSSTTGAALSASANAVNAEIIVNVKGSALVDLRVIDSNVYAKFDLAGLAAVPGTNISPSQIAGAQLIFGGRWFEVPKSLLASALPTPSAAQKAQAVANAAVARKIIDALTKVIDTAPYKTLPGGGYSETGTLQSIVLALSPTLVGIMHSPAPTNVKGRYTISFTLSGSSVSGGSLSITAPNATKGNMTATVSASVTHDAVSVDAPKGATVITPALLKSFGLGVG